MNTDKVRAAFETNFGGEGTLYASPGRINLIGEHVDYNGGYVLPGAIDKYMVIEIRPNGTDKVKVFSVDYSQLIEFKVNDSNKPLESWSHYVYGIVQEVKRRGGEVSGFDVAFSGDIPLGAGLSSSAALESVFAFALNDLFKCDFSKKDLSIIGQQTEHTYVGVKCGIMDQFASVFGKKNYLIHLNTETLEYKYIPCILNGYKLVLVDSKVKHTLVDNPYNRRRESCEAVVKIISEKYPQVRFLSHANMEMLNEVRSVVSEEDYKRAFYVIGEIERVEKTCDALKDGNLQEVGKNMYETHEGLSKYYEVSCEEIDFLNECAKKYGVAGSRIMGGGFGGCTINLVADNLYERFVENTVQDYTEKYNIVPGVYDVKIEDGARSLK